MAYNAGYNQGVTDYGDNISLYGWFQGSDNTYHQLEINNEFFEESSGSFIVKKNVECVVYFYGYIRNTSGKINVLVNGNTAFSTHDIGLGGDSGTISLNAGDIITFSWSLNGSSSFISFSYLFKKI